MNEFLNAVFAPLVVLYQYISDNFRELVVVLLILGTLAAVFVVSYQKGLIMPDKKISILHREKEKKPIELFKGSRYFGPSKSSAPVITSLADVKSKEKKDGKNLSMTPKSKVLRSLDDLQEQKNKSVQ